MRDWKGALDWYRENQTTADIGFNPNGMCLKVCRTARDIPSRYLTARQAQDATPDEYRVFSVANLRRGMIGFFDDPNDANRSGHVATLIGRVKGADVESLHDTLWETNSVKDGELVIVRGDYFEKFWGDKFQFGATWLNGFVLDIPARKKKTGPTGKVRLKNFRESRPNWDVKILGRLQDSGVARMRGKIEAIDKAVEALPDDVKDTRVAEFKETYRNTRVLKMSLLNKAVAEGRSGRVKAQRDNLRTLIKTILR